MDAPFCRGTLVCVLSPAPAESVYTRGVNRKRKADDDLDYDGARLQLVKSANKIFMDPKEGRKQRAIRAEVAEPEMPDAADLGYDTVDGGIPFDEVDGRDAVDAGQAEVKAQALYVLVTSHDAMQLSVTPTSVEVLSDLAKVGKARLKLVVTSARSMHTCAQAKNARIHARTSEKRAQTHLRTRNVCTVTYERKMRMYIHE